MPAGHAQGVYVALPTMATADAMFDRLRGKELWRRLFADGTASLALAHSADWLKLKLEEANRSDAGYGQDEELSASRHCTAWLSDNRKKALLADFGVGTVDQALLSVLPVRHQSLRLFGLSTKVLIVDEVHACDCYMGELLARLLYFHARLGGSAVLLSATLPKTQRAHYVRAFAQGAGFIERQPHVDSYPLATHLSAMSLTETPVPARPEAARRVTVHILGDEAAALAWLESAVNRGRCAVWVRNTVADALDTWGRWNAAHPDQSATLYHARFALVDRLEIGKQIERTFGRDSTRKTRRGRLVIATQVVEQSLDVDFDDMVIDLCPIDLVIQRAGRLQRHVRDADGTCLRDSGAADGRGGAVLAVLMPEPEHCASADWYTRLLPKAARVYPDHGKLWLTAEWLKEHAGFALPENARDMLETVYGEAALDRLPDAIKKAALDADGSCRADRGVARTNVLTFGVGYDPSDLTWRDDVETPTRLRDDPTVRLRLARLSEGQLACWAQVDKAIAWPLSEVSIPKRLVAGQSARFQRLIDVAKATMPDEGRYCLVVPLEHVAERWRGYASDSEGRDVVLSYASDMGLKIEQGAEDESDQ